MEAATCSCLVVVEGSSLAGLAVVAVGGSSLVDSLKTLGLRAVVPFGLEDSFVLVPERLWDRSSLFWDRLVVVGWEVDWRWPFVVVLGRQRHSFYAVFVRG